MENLSDQWIRHVAPKRDAEGGEGHKEFCLGGQTDESPGAETGKGKQKTFNKKSTVKPRAIFIRCTRSGLSSCMFLSFRFLGSCPIIPALSSFCSSNTKLLSVDYLLLVVTPKSPGDDGFLVCHYLDCFKYYLILFFKTLSSNHGALSAKMFSPTIPTSTNERE